jgi:hypothetical protein
LKVDLKRWNEVVFGNVERKKNIFLEELRVIGITGEGRALGVEESMKKAKIVSDLEKKIYWRK